MEDGQMGKNSILSVRKEKKTSMERKRHTPAKARKKRPIKKAGGTTTQSKILENPGQTTKGGGTVRKRKTGGGEGVGGKVFDRT